VKTALVLYTRDLRVHDHAALSAAVERFDVVVPLFVFDDVLLRDAGTPNRVSFLLDSLHDLRASLRARGGELIVRRGDVVAETVRTAAAAGATTVFVAADVSLYAQRRLERLRALLDVRVENTLTVVAPGEIAPDGRDHYRVFTPYWRRWRDEPRPAVARAPGHVRVPELDPGRLPDWRELTAASGSPRLPRGGEGEARRRLQRWLGDELAGYDDTRDDLAAHRTSRLSPYLHFGCISANEVAARAGAGEFLRQLCWRDFYAQLLWANPATAQHDLHPGRQTWSDDEEALDRWRHGLTGVPIVDAGMRQLREEGWMHNRARLIVAAFLTKTLRLDWRHGARVFADLLVDADVANNVGNWQWVAGTGVDTRQNRLFNPLTQAKRHDPSGEYVRRYVPELADIPGGAVHEPWRAPLAHVAPEYPAPVSNAVRV
jgi:deoxyribodipyrimidine photo-lyase